MAYFMFEGEFMLWSLSLLNSGFWMRGTNFGEDCEGSAMAEDQGEVVPVGRVCGKGESEAGRDPQRPCKAPCGRARCVCADFHQKGRC